MSLTTQDLIRQECSEIAEFLCEKNIAYGDSAVNPVRIFSKAAPDEQVRVRIDDKLNRLIQGKSYVGDDDVKDLVGYLILLRVLERIRGTR
jgi:hypothetical protein